jgi:hypothetical protein
MISDQQLATRESEIAKLFVGLRESAQLQADLHGAIERAGGSTIPSPAQRIEQILRRVESERHDHEGQGLRPADESWPSSLRRQFPTG